MSETIMSEAEKLLAEIYNDKYYPPVEGITKGCEAYFPCCDISQKEECIKRKERIIIFINGRKVMSETMFDILYVTESLLRVLLMLLICSCCVKYITSKGDK